MSSAPKHRERDSEKASLKGVTARGVVNGSMGRGCEGDPWN